MDLICIKINLLDKKISLEFLTRPSCCEIQLIFLQSNKCYINQCFIKMTLRVKICKADNVRGMKGEKWRI